MKKLQDGAAGNVIIGGKKGAEWLVKNLNSLYQFEDDAWKIYAYGVELRRYQAAYELLALRQGSSSLVRPISKSMLPSSFVTRTRTTTCRADLYECSVDRRLLARLCRSRPKSLELDTTGSR